MASPSPSWSPTRSALVVTSIYAVVSGVWIALSDEWVARNLLAFGRKREFAPEPTDMGGLVRGLAPMFSRLLSATFRFDVAVEPDLPPVLADPVSVEQALLNVLTNARDAMGDEGEIRLEATLRSLRGPLPSGNDRVCSAQPLEPGRYVVLAVRDSGNGIEPQVLSSVLTPFFTTKAAGEGSGLGLSMVDDLMREHRGALQVESKPAEGTTVRLFFPVADRDWAADSPTATKPTEIDRSRGSATILVVDDQEDLRRTVARVLERQGYQVLLASDGEEALELFCTTEVDIDLVLADLIMPRMGGLALYEAIREKHGSVPFVLTSGGAGVGEGVAGREGVADLPMIAKPWTVDELLDGVATALEAASP